MEFAEELTVTNRGPKIEIPAVIGAVIELGLCLDLTTSVGVQQVRSAHANLLRIYEQTDWNLPENSADLLRRNLDCAVIRLLHGIRSEAGEPAIDSVKGIFIEGGPVYETSGFYDKTHIQVCVCNPDCIKGVFRVPQRFLA